MFQNQITQVPEGLFKRIIRMLSNFDEALHATEASILERRVVRLEREVADLKETPRA